LVTLSNALSPLQRKLGVIFNIALGLFPGLLFFAWIERNCALPWWWAFENIRWPWIDFATFPSASLAIWNLALFLTFGAIHSLTAQPPFQAWLARALPSQLIRTAYMILTGVTVILVMGLWQNTGVILWAMPVSPAVSSTLSLALFWGLLALCGKVAQQFDAAYFFGWKQLRGGPEFTLGPTFGNERLQTNRAYSFVRHPIYTLCFLAFLLAPVMSLDRMLIVLGTVLYLSVGIPLEERKLIQLFGEEYKRYRERVPAVFPRLHMSSR
jgi:methanethiol S-methyltransferase